jgi:hypothetical protein
MQFKCILLQLEDSAFDYEAIGPIGGQLVDANCLQIAIHRRREQTTAKQMRLLLQQGDRACMSVAALS